MISKIIDICQCLIYQFILALTDVNYFTKIICITKPSKYIYYSKNDLIKLRSMDMFNDYILSIDHNKTAIVTIDDAIRLNKGGLLLLKVIKNR